MQSQFTDKAKTALLLAGRAAKSLHQNYVGTEQLFTKEQIFEAVWHQGF